MTSQCTMHFKLAPVTPEYKPILRGNPSYRFKLPIQPNRILRYSSFAGWVGLNDRNLVAGHGKVPIPFV